MKRSTPRVMKELKYGHTHYTKLENLQFPSKNLLGCWVLKAFSVLLKCEMKRQKSLGLLCKLAWNSGSILRSYKVKRPHRSHQHHRRLNQGQREQEYNRVKNHSVKVRKRKIKTNKRPLKDLNILKADGWKRALYVDVSNNEQDNMRQHLCD